MQKLFLCFFILLSVGTVHAQHPRISEKDSVELMQVWLPFQKALIAYDTEKVRAMSLKKLDCLACAQTDITPEWGQGYAVDTFFNCMRAFRADERLLGILKGVPTGVMVLEHERKPLTYKLKRNEKFRVYSVRYVIYKPNEFIQGHEGAAIFFDFVKINGRFVFYGYWTNP